MVPVRLFDRDFIACAEVFNVSLTVVTYRNGGARRAKSGSTAERHGHSVYAALSEVPKPARVRKNPFAGNSREATAGGKLFGQHCADCHGPKAGGTRHGPSLLGEEVQQATPGALFWILTNGIVWHGMPVWSRLPEPERWQIVTFLQSLNSQATRPATVR